MAEKLNHDKLIRWLRGLAAAAVTAAGSRATFTSDMYFEAADAIEKLQEATEKTIADIRLFSNSFDDNSVSKDFCIGIEKRLSEAMDKIRGGGNG